MDTETITINAGSVVPLMAGIYYVQLGANTRAEFYDNANDVWRTIISNGGAGLIISDGTNVRLYNSNTTNETSILRRWV